MSKGLDLNRNPVVSTLIVVGGWNGKVLLTISTLIVAGGWNGRDLLTISTFIAAGVGIIESD